MIEENKVEQIKGVTYSLPALLGKKHNNQSATTPEITSDSQFAQINSIDYSLDRILGQTRQGQHVYQHSPSHPLHFCVIYLAPGDYHRFHSPANWQILAQRHFAGELYSVSPWMVQSLRNLFVLNERVTLLGHWKHGFFSMIPVGATNVGSIKINFDDTLVTNKYDSVTGKFGAFEEKKFDVQVKKGDELGGFQLGSTIVLVFEAPKDFEFKVEHGQKVQVGQPLGHSVSN